MRLFTLVFLAAIAAVPSSGSAQDVVPDTLDWHGYFPLQVGNVWQYHFDSFHGIIGTTD